MIREDIHSIKQNGQRFFPETVADAVYVEEYCKTLSQVLKDIEKGELGVDSLIEILSKKFISKLNQDSAQEVITFLNGLLSIDTAIFKNGIKDDSHTLQSKWNIGYDNSGNSILNIDKINVRLEAIFRELIIQKLSSVSGGRIVSSASLKCTNVEGHNDYYKCYFDNGEKDEVTNQFVQNDQAICQVFTDSIHKYYWRLVIGVGKNYILLSKNDADGTGIPAINDDIIQLGNRSIIQRQNAIIETAFREPSYIQYTGINSFTLNGREKTVLSPSGNKFTGTFIFESGNSIEDELNKRNKYTLVLDNENSSVTCLFDGTVIGLLPTCKVWVYKGTEIDNSWNITLSCIGCNAIFENETISVTELNDLQAQVKVIASKEGETTLSQVMTISKTLGGEPLKAYYLYLVKGSEFFRENQGFVATLEGNVIFNGIDITSSYSSSQLVWERVSENPIGDPDWNLTHRNIGPVLTVTTDDLIGDTDIRLSFYDKSGLIQTFKNYKF